VAARTSASAASAVAIPALETGEKSQVSGQDRAQDGPLRVRQSQCHPGRLHDLDRLGARQRDASSGHEATQTLDSLAPHPVGVADVGEDHSPGAGAEQVGETTVEAGEHEVELTDDLVGQRHPGRDLAPAVGHPRGLGGQGVGAHRRGATGTADHQLGHRPQVPGVALEASQQLLGPGLLHRRRVELDDLVAAGPQPGHEGAVVVPGRFHADSHDPAERAASARASAPASTAKPLSVRANSKGATTTSP
jgi:hypothetical protein